MFSAGICRVNDASGGDFRSMSFVIGGKMTRNPSFLMGMSVVIGGKFHWESDHSVAKKAYFFCLNRKKSDKTPISNAIIS